jgi:hypothetical protein
MRSNPRLRRCAAIVVLLAAALLASPSSARADWKAFEHGLAVGVDVAVVRPLMACRALVGVVLFLPAYGFATLNGPEARDEVKELFVTEPIQSVTTRPLGDF